MANRFWVGGSATWDGTTTANWSTTTGGGSGASVPGSADIAIFDAASGAVTVTVAASIGGTNTIAQITSTAFTGTLDFSVNNPTITFTGVNGFSGSGAYTLKLGSSTFTMQAGGTFSIVGTTTTAGAFTLNLNNTGTFAQVQSISWGTQGAVFSSSIVNVIGRTNGTGVALGTTAYSLSQLNITGPAYVQIPLSLTSTIGTLTIAGTLAQPVIFGSGTGASTSGTVTTTSPSISYAIIRSVIFTNAATANNSWDNGNNGVNLTVNTPSAGGGSVFGS